MTSPFNAQVVAATSGSIARFSKRVFRFSTARPATRRASQRMRSPGVALGLLLLVLTILPQMTAAHDNTYHESVHQAASWLVAQQAEDGGFPGFSGESDPGATTDAVLALAAAEPERVEESIGAALDYLAPHALVVAQIGPGAAAKLSLALSAAGLDPRDFEGVNPLSIVQAAAATGRIGSGPFDHALGILALVAAEQQVPALAIDFARSSQAEDGGWGFDGATDAGSADTNTTGLMVQALVAAGLGEDEVVARGLEYLLSTQEPDGAFPYQPGEPADANSTALSLQALIAGEADESVIDSAMAALLEFQNDNGSFTWVLDPRDDNMFATVQAMPALAGLAMPIVSVDAGTPVAATPEPSPIAVLLAA